MLSFHRVAEMEPFKVGDKYIFRREDGMLEDVVFHCDFRKNLADIVCGILIGKDIQCRQLVAANVRCYNLTAEKIDADTIEYYAVCAAYKEFSCRSAKGTRQNARHFCLDKEIRYKEEGK